MSTNRFEVPVPKEIEVSFGKGVKGTIAIPHSEQAENPYEDGFAPATHKVALILHGQGGHRNYCYQKHLAHKLAAELGIYSLRIDFRGCGSSADNEDAKRGRVLDQDLEDISDAAKFIVDGSRNGLGINLTLSSLIAHSRGSVAMLLWAMYQDERSKRGDPDAILVPNLVNCCARYNSPTVLDRYPVLDEYFTVVPQTCLRHGEIQEVLITREELISLTRPDFSKINTLSQDWSVMSIYGLEDGIIPINDSSHFANALNRGRYSHRLELIPHADHNFYGEIPIKNDYDAEEHNKENLPLNRKKLVNYNYKVTELILDFLSPENELQRFLHSSSEIGRLSRWKNVEGVSNFRDIGGWKIHKPTFSLENSGYPKESSLQYYVKPHTAFRCASVANITSRGLQTLQSLGVKKIFDLRSDGECEADGAPIDFKKYGITRVHAPVFSKDDYSPGAIAVRYTNLMTSWNTYVHVYQNMLEFGVEAYKTIFEHILNENTPFVFHCTAGKDRTGILGMLILLLLGVDKNTIAKEYELTTIGLKPDHPHLKEKFQDTVKEMKKKLGEGSDVEMLISQGRKNWSIEEDGFNNLISSRYEAMLATIEMFNDNYGGILSYLKDELKFTDSQIRKIYENLIVVDPQNLGFEATGALNWDHRNAGKVKL
ncbi:protein-tyrosine phosphatase-like protein [Scheffersomyces xylosifermentans]|uniref:protein-tyrosine phosphatase-like protein n=1 Tax=Scheffersomyces xylosifermentans TaxID=1304137 RepID=UPI00315C71EB